MRKESLIHIRPARAADAHALWRLRAEAIRAEARHHYSPREVEAWVRRRSPASFPPPIAQNRILVAESSDGALAGYAQLSLETGEVQAIYVDPAWTRLGIGLRLLEALEERARLHGVSRLHLDAALNAVPFYERAGYHRERDVTYPLEGGGEYACVFMTKSLE